MSSPHGSGPERPRPSGEPVPPPSDGAPTTVLPGGPAPGSSLGSTAGSTPTSSVRRPGGPRPAPTRGTPRPPDAGRPTPSGKGAGASGGKASTGTRRARLALQRIDPWSVFTYTLVASLFLGIALVVAAFVLYSVLGGLGVPDTLNELYTELTDEQDPILTSGRVLAATAVLAAVNVVLLTLLATLGALLYNLCASFTGGIELTLGERDG